MRFASADTAGRVSVSFALRTYSISGSLGIFSFVRRVRRPGLSVWSGNGVTASPAMAATRTPAKLELVETMRHRFWLAAKARSAASRYGHGSGKNASGSTGRDRTLADDA